MDGQCPAVDPGSAAPFVGVTLRAARFSFFYASEYQPVTIGPTRRISGYYGRSSRPAAAAAAASAVVQRLDYVDASELATGKYPRVLPEDSKRVGLHFVTTASSHDQAPEDDTSTVLLDQPLRHASLSHQPAPLHTEPLHDSPSSETGPTSVTAFDEPPSPSKEPPRRPAIRRRPLIIEDSAESLVIPRVTQASLPPVVLPSGRLECPACGGSFESWATYYGHIIAPDNKVCAWILINRIDMVTPADETRRNSGLFDADLVARWRSNQKTH